MQIPIFMPLVFNIIQFSATVGAGRECRAAEESSGGVQVMRRADSGGAGARAQHILSTHISKMRAPKYIAASKASSSCSYH